MINRILRKKMFRSIQLINYLQNSLISRGARGGKGSDDKGYALGALVRGVIELQKGDQLYFIVGQEGTDACPKVSIYKYIYIYL